MTRPPGEGGGDGPPPEELPQEQLAQTSIEEPAEISPWLHAWDTFAAPGGIGVALVGVLATAVVLRRRKKRGSSGGDE